MSRGLVLVGGGGHCASCIDVIEAEGRLPILGFLDLPALAGSELAGYRCLGTDADLPALAKEGCAFLVTVGQVKSAEARRRLFGALRALGATLATVVSPLARVSRTAKVGAGSIVMHGALVNAGAEVGENCIVNSRALIEHDARVEGHCHVSTAAVVNGGSRLGEGSFLGSGAVILNQVAVGRGCVVGAGAVVVRDLPDGGTWAGNPARPLGGGR